MINDELHALHQIIQEMCIRDIERVVAESKERSEAIIKQLNEDRKIPVEAMLEPFMATPPATMSRETQDMLVDIWDEMFSMWSWYVDKRHDPEIEYKDSYICWWRIVQLSDDMDLIEKRLFGKEEG